MGGRPIRLDSAKLGLALRLHREDEHTIKEICQMMGISTSTLYNYLTKQIAMSSGRRKQIPSNSLLHLRQRLDRLPRKSSRRSGEAEWRLHHVSQMTSRKSPRLEDRYKQPIQNPISLTSTAMT